MERSNQYGIPKALSVKLWLVLKNRNRGIPNAVSNKLNLLKRSSITTGIVTFRKIVRGSSKIYTIFHIQFISLKLSHSSIHKEIEWMKTFQSTTKNRHRTSLHCSNFTFLHVSNIDSFLIWLGFRNNRKGFNTRLISSNITRRIIALREDGTWTIIITLSIIQERQTNIIKLIKNHFFDHMSNWMHWFWMDLYFRGNRKTCCTNDIINIILSEEFLFGAWSWKNFLNIKRVN